MCCVRRRDVENTGQENDGRELQCLGVPGRNNVQQNS